MTVTSFASVAGTHGIINISFSTNEGITLTFTRTFSLILPGSRHDRDIDQNTTDRDTTKTRHDRGNDLDANGIPGYDRDILHDRNTTGIHDWDTG